LPRTIYVARWRKLTVVKTAGVTDQELGRDRARAGAAHRTNTPVEVQLPQPGVSIIRAAPQSLADRLQLPPPHSHWLSYLLRQILTALMAKPFQPKVRILHGRRKNPDKSVVPVSLTNSVNDILETASGPNSTLWFHALKGGDSPVEGANAFVCRERNTAEAE
jgi:hypothetical protein